jgi:hypothetical protein
LRASIQNQASPGAGLAAASLHIRNASSNACVLPPGWAPVGVGAPDYQPTNATQVNHPGPGTRIKLQPGGGAWAAMKWRTGDECSAIGDDTFAISWDGTWIPAPYSPGPDGKLPFCDGMTIGAIQPTLTGINFTG